MKVRSVAVVTLLTLIVAAPAPADESGAFVVRLGQDTTSVEQYRRSATRLEVTQVGRAPRVLQRQFTYDYEKGDVAKFKMVVGPPGSTTPTQIMNGTFGSDSARFETQSGTQPPQRIAVVIPAGTVVVAGSSPWAGYEGAIMKLMKGKPDSLLTTMYFVGSGNTGWLRLRKVGRDSVSIANERGDGYQAKVDKSGRILGVRPVAGTVRVDVERVATVDVPVLAASFAAREQAGAGIGVLSPRDTVNASAAGASLWIDYSRPGKRGRVIYGNVVPYGELWRTGANAATQFKTDKALDFGGTVVPAGFYTLWTIPAPDGWKLIINSETGQAGTSHKADKDLFTIPMKVSVLPQTVERFTIGVEPSGEGGALNLDWDTTRASAAFTVKP